MVEEIRLETICDIENVEVIVKKTARNTLYEELDIDIVPLIDETCFY